MFACIYRTSQWGSGFFISGPPAMRLCDCVNFRFRSSGCSLTTLASKTIKAKGGILEIFETPIPISPLASARWRNMRRGRQDLLDTIDALVFD
ncbi:hypothetical protein Plhal304r1_c033g0105491 [Plasmopara halstedii]